MEKTKIDWCDSTWNPVTGCLHGCDYCYARNMARRFSYEGETLDVPAELQRVWVEDSKGSGTGNHVLRYPVDLLDGRRVPYPFGFEPTLHRYRFNDYTGKQGRNIFVCSMADLFGEWVPNEWIEEVFNACEAASQHTYLFLTKNPERYYCLEDNGDLPDYQNMWYGITVTNKAQLERAVKAAGNLGCNVNTFLSIEPLHEDITQSEYWDPVKLMDYFDWFIIGTETGRRAGIITPEREWIQSIVKTCSDIEKPVFLKSGRGIMEEIWGEPLIQEFPEELIQEEK